MKGMIYAAKVMAVASLRVIEDSDLLAKAKEEFQLATKGAAYVCPVTEDMEVPQ